MILRFAKDAQAKASDFMKTAYRLEEEVKQLKSQLVMSAIALFQHLLIFLHVCVSYTCSIGKDQRRDYW